jgi:hypothetical protein
MSFVKAESGDRSRRPQVRASRLWRRDERSLNHAALHKAIVKNNANAMAGPAAMRQTSAATLANH